jgi:L-threonylcarbamoyladenylate synthase
LKKRPDAFSVRDPGGPDNECIGRAARTLVAGGIVAFPTETCYGLAVDPFNEQALENLFRAKNRPADKPVLLLISNVSLLDSLVTRVPDIFLPLIERFWPGPLTLIFPARSRLSPLVTGGTGTVGVRISPHPVAQALGKAFGGAITATSANLSGKPPARSADQIQTLFGKTVDVVLDGGMTPASLCSTIVCECAGRLQLIRSGVIGLAEFGLAADTPSLRK